MEQSGLVADEVIGGRIETKSLLGDECTVTAGRVEEKSRGGVQTNGGGVFYFCTASRRIPVRLGFSGLSLLSNNKYYYEYFYQLKV